MNTHLANYFFFLFSLVITGYILAIGQSILMPLVIAIFFWYLINALARKIGTINAIPSWGAMTLSITVIAAVLFKLVDLISANLQSFIRQAAGFQDQYQKVIFSWLEQYSFLQVDSLQNFFSGINLGSIAGNIINAVGNIAAMSITILLYVIFLFLEQKTFSWKLKSLIKNKTQRKKVETTLCQIGTSLENYVGLKTIVSLLMGIIGYGVLIIFDINNAVFWGLIIAILNFIPYIGTVLAFILPSLAALAQTGNISETMFVTALLAANAIVIGSVVEPKVFGKSLNLSPIVLLLSLAVWGSLWGVLGMILCIPLMVGLMIVLRQFDKTRPIAILMAERE